MNTPSRILETPHGAIPFPAFFPVTTFGDKFPLDRLVRPYLRRLSPCLMVSRHYARGMKSHPPLPVFIDSGGFASLFDGSAMEEHGDYASIRTKEGEEINPLDVLRFQERNADLGATLDFIIPPECDGAEACRRQEWTWRNALYALRNRKAEKFLLYASLQCWDAESARDLAARYVAAGFQAIAIGGLVPRARDRDYLTSVIAAVRDAAPDCLLHVFGIGSLELIPLLLDAGADSFDSSSYVRSAVNAEPRLGLHTNLYAAIDNLRRVNAAISEWEPCPF